MYVCIYIYLFICVEMYIHIYIYIIVDSFVYLCRYTFGLAGLINKSSIQNHENPLKGGVLTVAQAFLREHSQLPAASGSLQRGQDGEHVLAPAIIFVSRFIELVL